MWQNKKETLLRAEDVETLESYIDAFDGYFGKMAAYLDEFVAKGIARKVLRKKKSVPIWKLRYGTLMPGTTLILTRVTILLCNGCLIRSAMRKGAVCGIIDMPAHCCIAVN